jgi:hypothetical protein
MGFFRKAVSVGDFQRFKVGGTVEDELNVVLGDADVYQGQI